MSISEALLNNRMLSGNESSMYYEYPAMTSSLNIMPFAMLTSDFLIQTTFSMNVRWNNTGAVVKSFLAHHADIGNETDGVLNPVEDVTVNGVWTAAVLNSMVGVGMLLLYEVLRRVMPSVYGSALTNFASQADNSSKPSWSPLWIFHVLRIPWSEVRVKVGLDAYMFLRFIRLAMRITSISALWAMIILWPTFYSGDGKAKGWYTYSMANIVQSDWRMWIPFCYIYLLSAYVLWSIRQEYRHYLALRMDFLSGKCEVQHVHPQQRYSIMVNSIPKELRSDQALYDYFSSLFPHRVHSARVILNLPDLEKIAAKRVRITRRLEKSIALLHATGMRPQHIVGRPRFMCMGIETELSRRLSECNCSENFSEKAENDNNVWNKYSDGPPRRGYMVDSIDYYTYELASINESVEEEQKRKLALAELGNTALQASTWIDSQNERVLDTSPSATKFPTPRHSNTSTPQGGHTIIATTKPQYGSLEQVKQMMSDYSPKKHNDDDDPKQYSLLDNSFFLDGSILWEGEELAEIEDDNPNTSRARRLLDKLGFDFVLDLFRLLKKRLELHMAESGEGSTMSATGFVTFYDLASVACAVGPRLSAVPETLTCKVAPEPRDIIWANAHIDKRLTATRENMANAFIGLGAILWSIPIAVIQAFATADSIAQIPGCAWILANPEIASFVNGYLPVVALLSLLLILPIIFEAVAQKYETRKTQSEIQKSVFQRYFLYQLANIYISITAGSIWRSIYEIMEKPYSCFVILGNSLPTVAGYFISLLLTKILAGLPMILLRFGALSRMVFLKTFFYESRMTQKELDEVYKDQPILYGCEYPTQLLVIIICFTYAAITPIILPFGALYFFGSLLVYKKQALFVYRPTYESGGSLFPSVCDRTIIGLILSQITFLSYCVIRHGRTQPILLIPLPIITYFFMKHFRLHYGTPGKALSLERARQIDHCPPSDTSKFDRDAYRQPVLAEGSASPLPYRRGQNTINDEHSRNDAYGLTEDTSTILGASILGGHENSHMGSYHRPECKPSIQHDGVRSEDSASTESEQALPSLLSSELDHAVDSIWANQFPSLETDLPPNTSEMWYSADSD